MGKRCANILNGLSKDMHFNAECTGSHFLLCALKESTAMPFVYTSTKVLLCFAIPNHMAKYKPELLHPKKYTLDNLPCSKH